MKYLSVCSGIEAATVAWHPLGFVPVGYSEIEPFPSAVLKHHYPDVPNFGDMTKYKDWPDAAINILVGGTPCQSFSVAGLRKGLDDPRGNLTLVYLAIAAKYRPEWLVWENVPGVLSDKTGAFGAFLGGLGQLGYGFAYRILDAQYFGVAQRRRRVFVVGCAGGWQRAAAVLFERHSLQGHPAPSRKAGQAVAGTIAARFGSSRNNHEEIAFDGSVIAPEISNALLARDYKDSRPEADQGAPLVARSRPIAWDEEINPSIDVAGTVVRGGAGGRHDGVAMPISFPWQMGGTMQIPHDVDLCGTLVKNQTQAVQRAMQVRRLTPRECERLQGFPDDYTQIPWRNKPADQCPDGPRYKALGNSMAVPVMHWIGERIQQVAAIPAALQQARG